jgi:hypothetical protein
MAKNHMKDADYINPNMTLPPEALSLWLRQKCCRKLAEASS